ncbi:carbohydrate ABC transporter membrane protein 2 (CUT1 family) [Melghirimyces profundicolus]|uniref:Carbohydrate ABC transporter membrane protein 2 (CUT1 family) n=1 Tax=Melghirimyces profundicolus TaxID=1242148 RepID=A0A2T6C802_9BACL|nr:carbohydrate ABC transporter permease [Melghirimyces profundicolus]PTX64435.1 carbohydrate ABC transporter membrane protein 2 (CUT1 family) [Melghirimyces profundicolus]
MALKSEERRTQRFTFVFLVIAAVVWLAPMVWVLSTSLKPESQAISWPLRWIPETLTFENYFIILGSASTPVIRWFGNSLLIASLHTFFILIVDSMAAYAYARMRFKGRDVLFWILMTTMMIPPVITYIPLYSIVDKLGWVDTPWAMIIPGLGGVFGIFLLRQFFLGIPYELEEAARIDGAGAFQIFFRIILPLAKPALVTVALFTFMSNWNDFFWPLIVTNSVEMRTLPVGLSILQGSFNIQYAKLMAATVLSALPVLVLFLFAQRFFVKGATMTGIKG